MAGTAPRSAILAVVAGVAAGAVFLALMEANVRLVPEASAWKPTISSLWMSISPIAPGFVAGWVAARKGFAVGAAASVLSSVVWSIYVRFVDPQSITDAANAVLPAEVTYAVAAIIVGGVCGIAGAAVAKEKR